MGRIVTDAMLAGFHEDNDGKQEINRHMRIETDPEAGTVETAFESRGRGERRRLADLWRNPQLAVIMAYLQFRLAEAEAADAYANREITPDWKPVKSKNERRKQCFLCEGTGGTMKSPCDECSGFGWLPA